MNQTKTPILVTTDGRHANMVRLGGAARTWRLARSLPLLVRYAIVSGAIGLPASIVQLMLLVYGYQAFIGHVGPLVLNALWLVNFEIGLLRNFFLHCLYSWGVPPTRTRVQHAHVAAMGALVVDLIAFNVVVATTHVIPFAQLCGAGSGFLVNFFYNKLKTFAIVSEAIAAERST